MRVEKKTTIGADRHTLRVFTFSMGFVMLFVIPFFQSYSGSQAKETTIAKPDSVAPIRDPFSTAMEALHTAAVGGPGGLTISRRMDQLASGLQADCRNVSIIRIEEGIIATFDSRELFDEDSYEIQSSARHALKAFARHIREVEDIGLLVEGHTDNTAEEHYNLALSDHRARAVSSYLIRQGIRESHIRAKGYGEKQPLVADSTVLAKQLNRRIEIVLFAGDETRRLAVSGKLDGLIASKGTK